MKALEEKGLVKRLVAANKGYFKVTDKGMTWSTDTGGPNQSVGPAEPNESVQAEPDCAAKANESVATKPNESVQRSYIPLNQINQNQEKPLPDDVLQKKWKGYLDSRKEKRRTMNEAALSLAVDSIGRVVKDGYKLVDILDSMTVGGWQTVTSEYMQGKAAKKKTFKPAGQTTSTDPLGQNTAAYEAKAAAELAAKIAAMTKKAVTQ